MDTIAIQQLKGDKFFIYNLVKEEPGWIFRRTDDSMFGVSGHYQYKHDCIDSARRLGLFVFERIDVDFFGKYLKLKP